jgi:hypothetical protein
MGKNVATSKTKLPLQPPAGQASPTVRVRTFVTKVYCTLCTRTVEATVGITQSVIGKRRWGVEPGQRCKHCGASLDAAYVLGNMS